MSQVGWNDLPILPLRCILQHLSTKDVLTATATCRNWRHALPLCNPRKETLLLQVTETDKNAFLTEIFGRNVKKLQVHLNTCGPQFDDFMDRIIPMYNNISILEEIILIGPAYLQLQPHVMTMKIDNAALDNLILGQMNNLKNLTILGCNFLPDNPFMTKSLLLKKNVPIFLPYAQQQEEPYLSQCIRVRRDGCQFNSLHHICIDYEMLHTLSLMEMSNLPNLMNLSINILNNTAQHYERLNWLSLNEFRQNKIGVTLNIIGVPSDRFEEIVDNILVEDLPLVALRVLFCKTFQPMLLHHVMENYSSTLVELQWVDSQVEMSHMDRIRDVRISSRLPAPYTFDQSVNPFILVCWQCKVLQKLVIHGYWLWHYDLLGMARLRYSTLRELEISAIYQKGIAPKAYTEAMAIIPVFVGKEERTVQPAFVKQMNDCLHFEWRPAQPWSDLHPALGANSDETLKSDYVRSQILKPAPSPLGNT